MKFSKSVFILFFLLTIGSLLTSSMYATNLQPTQIIYPLNVLGVGEAFKVKFTVGNFPCYGRVASAAADRWNVVVTIKNSSNQTVGYETVPGVFLVPYQAADMETTGTFTLTGQGYYSVWVNVVHQDEICPDDNILSKSFSVLNLPDPISNIFPPNGTTGAPLDQAVSWTNGSAAISQTNVHFWPTPTEVNFNTGVVVTSTSPNFNNYTPSTPWPGNTLMRWGVSQTNGVGETQSGPFEFTTTSAPPDPISNISPAQGATNVRFNDTEFGWTNAQGLISQTKVFINPNAATIDWNSNAVITNTSPSFNYYRYTSPLPENSQVAWGVQQTNSAGSTNNGPFTFTTSCGKPQPITNTSPMNNATDVPTNTPLAFNNGSCDIYQTIIHVWTSGTEPSWNTNSVLTTTSTITSYTPPEGWPPSTTVSWGVEQNNSYGTTQNGPYSFTTIGSPPDPITNILPSNGTIDVPLDQSIAWANGNNPIDQADVYFGPSPEAVDWNAAPVMTTSGSTFNTYDPPGDLLPGTTYSWGIRQFNEYGLTLNGPFTFVTQSFSPPGIITNVNPPNGAVNIPLDQTLSWTNGENQFDQTVVHFWPSPTSVDFNTGIVVSSSLSTFNSYTPSTSWPPNTLIRWGVTQTNGDGTTNNGPYEFTTGWGPPDPISNIFPSNGTTGAPLDQPVSWTNGNTVFSQTDVHFWPSPTSVDFNTGIVVSSSSSTFNSYSPTSPWPANTLIRWGVSQTNGVGETQSGPFEFTTTSAPPDPISNIFPPNGTTGAPLDQPVSWTNGNTAFSQTDVHFWPSPTQVDFNTGVVVTSTSPNFNNYTPSTPWPANTLMRWGVTQTNGVGTTQSGPFEFTTTSAPPDPISNISPPHGTTGAPLDQAVGWTNGIKPYSQTDVHFWPSPTPVDFNTGVIATSTSPNFNSYTPSTPWPANTLIRWGVTQTNGDGTTNNGPFEFTTGLGPPDPITDILPPDGMTDIPLDQAIAWTNGTNTIGQTDVYFGPSPEAVNWNAMPVMSTTVSTFNTYDPTGDLLPGTTYSWGIRQYNVCGFTLNGPFTFITQNVSAPGLITNVNPPNGAVNIPLDQTLSWTNGEYQFDQTVVHIWPSQEETNWNTHAVVSTTLSTFNSYTPTENWTPNSQIWWGVEQQNQHGTTQNGPYNFRTEELTDPDLDLLLYNIQDPYGFDEFIMGMIDITYSLSTNGYFFNVVATNPMTSQALAIVNNLFYPGLNQAAEPPTFSSSFDFTDLLSPNNQIPSLLNVKVYVSGNVLIPPFSDQYLTADFLTQVTPFNQYAINTSSESVIPSVSPVISVTHVVADPLAVNIYRDNVRNLDLDDTQHGDTDTYAGDFNACVPTASANSVKWLETKYDDVKLPSDMTLRKTMETLSSKMKRTRNGGTERPNMVSGILDYVEEQNLPLEVKFQSFYIDGNITSSTGKSTARNLNTASQNKPQWDFIKEQMQNGENVIMNYTWKSGSTWCGHSVCLTGVEEYLSGKKKIKFKHDRKQGEAGGTKEDAFDVTTDEDGWVRFGPGDKYFVHTVVAESPIPFGRETAAWLNELFANPESSGSMNRSITAANPELFEVVLSSTATDLNNFKITLYDGSNGKQYNSFYLNNLFKTEYGNVSVFFNLFNNDELKSPPAGLALSYSGTIIPGQFWSYGGSFKAVDGDAQGLTSTNLGDVIPNTGFALSGSGIDYQSFGWEYTNTSTAGMLNSNQTYTEDGPGKPIPNNPQHQTKNLNTTVSFEWAAGLNAQSYELQYTQDYNFINAVSSLNNITSTIKEISSLGYGNKYYWRIRSKNNSGVSAYSDKIYFTTKLQAPTNLAAQLDAQNKVNLSWSDNSSNEDGFALEKKLNQGQFSELTRVNQNNFTFKDNDVFLNSTYEYQVRAFNANAESDYSNTAIILVSSAADTELLPAEYQLYQNYPNPFNPTTTIRFDIPRVSYVKISLYDLLGKKLRQIIENNFSAGSYKIEIDLENLSSGIYYYTMECENFHDTKKLILLK